MRQILRSFGSLSLFLLLLVWPTGWAQQPAAPGKAQALTGDVEGTVYAADTRTPLRFAAVILVPVPGDPPAPPVPAAEANTTHLPNKQPAQVRQVQLVQGLTDIDGHFHLRGVPPGDYLAGALAVGYVTPGSPPSYVATEDELKAKLAALPTVHVSVGVVSTVRVELHRGAVLAGRLLYADGTPAVGQPVGWQDAKVPTSAELRGKVASPRWSALAAFDARERDRKEGVTDDEGRYRLAGIPPGKYVLTTVLNVDHGAARVSMTDGSSPNQEEQTMPEMVPVFAPGVFQLSAAKVFDLHGDERVLDADMKIDTSGLHTIKGFVFASTDHHAPGTMLLLRAPGDPSPGRFAQLAADGSFALDDLPAGTYSLQVIATDRDVKNQSAPIVMYTCYRQTVTVSEHDVTLGTILLRPQKPGEHDCFADID